MTETLLLLIVIIFAVLVGFLIPAILELRKTAREITSFVKMAETTLKPAVEELNETLKSLRTTLDDVNSVADDVKKFSSAVGDVADNVKELSNMIGEIPGRLSGIKAAVVAAIEYIVAKFSKKGD